MNNNFYQGGLNFSAGGLAGVEFFLTKEVSLGAEYMLGYSYTNRSDEEFVNGPTTTKFKTGPSSTINVNATGALMLAIYF